MITPGNDKLGSYLGEAMRFEDPRGKDLVPSSDELLNPALQALHDLGGSASVDEHLEAVIEQLELPAEITEVPHGDDTNTSELGYRLAWSRTYLKKYGLIDNSKRGVWALTAKGVVEKKIDPAAVVRYVREENKKKREQKGEKPDSEESPLDEEIEGEEDWRLKARRALLEMPPDGFERLCQRLLRESGFIEVKVTRRSGDGGIDGYGVVRLASMLSFPVLFQSKRYQGNVSSNAVRDFRGAMIGRADKGLIITTGGFSVEAKREATRDGAPPIDLIDGDQLINMLKELDLGMKREMVERVEVDAEWFERL